MKRTFLFLLTMMTVGLISRANAQNTNATPASGPDAVASAGEPSLGSYARAARKEKKQPAAKKFDNDNLPMNDKISVVGNGARPDPIATAQVDDTDASSEPAGSTTAAAANPGPVNAQGRDEKQVNDEWKVRITQQKDEVDMLSRELNLSQREYQVRTAAFYADAGDRLRNQAAWDKEDADYKQKLAEKQKALDEAKEKMSGMQEDARKAGASPSSLEPGSKPQD